MAEPRKEQIILLLIIIIVVLGYYILEQLSFPTYLSPLFRFHPYRPGYYFSILSFFFSASDLGLLLLDLGSSIIRSDKWDSFVTTHFRNKIIGTRTRQRERRL